MDKDIRKILEKVEIIARRSDMEVYFAELSFNPEFLQGIKTDEVNFETAEITDVEKVFGMIYKGHINAVIGISGKTKDTETLMVDTKTGKIRYIGNCDHNCAKNCDGIEMGACPYFSASSKDLELEQYS
jgi:hypothetical protein